mmetsp:Transcript_9748/g.17654  ORF Transcript_9748/g.17654 Transcript_9748/m.17654 type:complete len:93 (-) Transcript_9748:745-1023(-)
MCFNNRINEPLVKQPAFENPPTMVFAKTYVINHTNGTALKAPRDIRPWRDSNHMKEKHQGVNSLSPRALTNQCEQHNCRRINTAVQKGTHVC